jgi:hypothetical protein
VERQGLAALSDFILPPDDQPGGAALGAVAYIETLLTALEYDPPRLYAGGPFSNRNPIPLPDGRPSTVYPDDSFSNFLPLTPDQEQSWRLLLYGSAGVPGGGPNDAVLGPLVGWRDLCRKGLADVATRTGLPLDQLTSDALADAWSDLSPDFAGFIVQRIVEAAFAAPEYGGNRNLLGWKMIYFEGDTLPMGYAPFDMTAGRARERPDAPISTPDPGEDPEPMDAQTELHLQFVVDALGGRMAP